MSVSGFRSKLPILTKYLLHQRIQCSRYHGGFNSLLRNSKNHVNTYRYKNPPHRTGNIGTIFYYGTAPKSSFPSRNWKERPPIVDVGIWFIILFGGFNIVPYSERYHLVLPNLFLDNPLWELEQIWVRHIFESDNLLSPDDEQSIRALKIMKNIVDGTNAGLKLERCSSVVFTDQWTRGTSEHVHKTSNTNVKDNGRISRIENHDSIMKTSNRNVMDDRKISRIENHDNIIKTSNTNVKDNGRISRMDHDVQFGTKHLNGLKWELRVVDSELLSACYTYGEKIVISSGLLKKLESDELLAMALAHEVGHGVAQHISEDRMTVLCVLIGSLIIDLSPFWFIILPQVVRRLFNTRMELEADYIGLMLMASAGYDPTNAPKLFEEILRPHESKQLKVLLTHPEGRRRAEMLKKPEVMGVALEIYNEVKAGNGVISFVY